jgi:hypothetical protein
LRETILLSGQQPDTAFVIFAGLLTGFSWSGPAACLDRTYTGNFDDLVPLLRTNPAALPRIVLIAAFDGGYGPIYGGFLRQNCYSNSPSS